MKPRHAKLLNSPVSSVRCSGLAAIERYDCSTACCSSKLGGGGGGGGGGWGGGGEEMAVSHTGKWHGKVAREGGTGKCHGKMVGALSDKWERMGVWGTRGYFCSRLFVHACPPEPIP